MTSNSPDTTSAFGYDVYVSPAKPFVAQEPPRFGGEPTWSPTSSTLIFGRQDAVLVDALLTTSEALHLADWVEAHGKNLTTIYITHGHGDHFFGLSVLLSRFPGAHAVATPGTVEVMRLAAAPAAVARYFGPRFPNQLPEHIVIAEALDGPTITLEGAELIAVEAGHTDTINTTFLHVPALDLVVAGDVVYNDVHLFVAQTTHESRQDWIAALDLIESENPRVVVAGHKRPGAGDPPSSIADTRVYLRDFDRLSQSAQSDAELFEAMMSLYPNRLNGQGWLMF